MKNRKKLVITLIGVIVLGIGLFVYQTFIKKQLHFKENLTVEINGKFNQTKWRNTGIYSIVSSDHRWIRRGIKGA